MAADPNIAIEKVLAIEGGELLADDHGRGPARWGITLQTAQELRPHWTAETIENLTREQAAEFYLAEWWIRLHFYLLNDQTVANKVFQISVNLPARAIQWLQSTVGVTKDGLLGPVTADAVNSADPEFVVAAFAAMAKNYYQSLGEEYAAERQGLVNRVDLA